MATEVPARGAKVEVRTVTLTKALLKQCRTFNDIPPKPYCEVVDNGSGIAKVKVLTDHAVGWFRGTVLGDDDRDYVLFVRDGDLLLGRFWRTITWGRWILPKECKQLYL